MLNEVAEIKNQLNQSFLGRIRSAIKKARYVMMVNVTEVVMCMSKVVDCNPHLSDNRFMPKPFELPVVVGAFASHFEAALCESLSIFREIFDLEQVRRVVVVYVYFMSRKKESRV